MTDRPKDTPLRRQVADVLRRARKLPIGHDRNDLRQLAIGLLWLERRGLASQVEDALGKAQSYPPLRS